MIHFFSVCTQREAWEDDLGITINEEQWEAALNYQSAHQFIQFKVIHGLHYSCTKTNSFYPSASPICPKCKSENGTLGHLFWACPKINKFQAFKKYIFECLNKAYNCNVSADPHTVILGQTKHLHLSIFEQKAIQYSIAWNATVCIF